MTWSSWHEDTMPTQCRGCLSSTRRAMPCAPWSGAMDEPSVPLSLQELMALYQRLTMLEASEAMTEEKREAAEAELRQRKDELVETSQRLATLAQRYHALFALAPDGYLVTDAAGVIAEANRAATLLLGSALEELLGKPLIVYVAQADHQ